MNEQTQHDRTLDTNLAAFPFRFRLWQLFYAIAVLAAALGLLGAWGIGLAVVVGVFWGSVFWKSDLQKFQVVVGVLLAMACAAMLGPLLQLGRIDADRQECEDRLKLIAAALDVYRVSNDGYPPAFIAGPDGKPAHSWRVLLLPYLGEQELYDAYRFDEPWNGPNNAKLISRVPGCYQCPTQLASDRHNGQTSYLAIARAEMVGLDDAAGLPAHLLGRYRSTVVLIESPASKVRWTEPRDLDIRTVAEELAFEEDPADHGHCDGHRDVGLLRDEYAGRNKLTGDDWTQFIFHGEAEYLHAALFGGDVESYASDPLYAGGRVGYGTWNAGTSLQILVLLILFVLPLSWFRQQRSAHSNTATATDPQADEAASEGASTR